MGHLRNPVDPGFGPEPVEQGDHPVLVLGHQRTPERPHRDAGINVQDILGANTFPCRLYSQLTCLEAGRQNKIDQLRRAWSIARVSSGNYRFPGKGFHPCPRSRLSIPAWDRPLHQGGPHQRHLYFVSPDPREGSGTRLSAPIHSSSPGGAVASYLCDEC